MPSRDIFEVLGQLEGVLKTIRIDSTAPKSQDGARVLLDKLAKLKVAVQEDLKDYVKRQGRKIRREWILGKEDGGKRR